jgi:hypothetical protein
MKIYDREGFPNPLRIRAVVAAKGLEREIEWVSVDLIGAEHKQPPFLRKTRRGPSPCSNSMTERASSSPLPSRYFSIIWTESQYSRGKRRASGRLSS